MEREFHLFSEQGTSSTLREQVREELQVALSQALLAQPRLANKTKSNGETIEYAIFKKAKSKTEYAALVTKMLLRIRLIKKRGSRGSLDEMDNLDTDVFPVIPTLQDLAVKVTAKHFPCHALENHSPPVDESLLKKIASQAFPQDEKEVKVMAKLTDKFDDWEQGIALADSSVTDMCQVGFMVTATVQLAGLSSFVRFKSSTEGNSSRVSVTFEKQKIMSSSCASCPNDIWCQHVVAAVAYRIRNADKVPVYAPMTESLATLNRDQLQKLLQYAVNDDPGGVLAKVFKYLGEIQDTNSDMNRTYGAPDPTFGTSPDDKSQWQLSLDKLKRRLEDHLQELDHQHHNGMMYYLDDHHLYINSYDVLDKADCQLFGYIQKVLDLAQIDQIAYAADALILVTGCIFEAMEKQLDRLCPQLAMFCHDVEWIFTMFVLNPNGGAKEKLLEAARGFNKRSVKLKLYKVAHSKWAECPSLLPLYTDQLDGDVMRDGFFLEPLCAGLMKPWPEHITSSQHSDQSVPDEDIVVSILRIKTLIEFGWANDVIRPQIFNTLHKLVSLSKQESILSCCVSSEDEQHHFLRHSGEGASGKGKALARKRSRAKNSSHTPSKRLKVNPEGTLSREQICYCILYLSNHMLRENQLQDFYDEQKDKFLSYALHGIELSRYRTVAKSSEISLLEQNWLWRIEESIQEILQKDIPKENLSHAVGPFLKAITSEGLDFYDGALPLMLLQVVTLFSRSDRLLHPLFLKMCVLVFGNSPDPTQRFTLPVSRGYDFIHEVFDFDGSGMVSRRQKDFAAKKLHYIADQFLAKVNENTGDTVMLTEFLHNLEKMTNYRLLQMITKELRHFIYKLTEPQQKESCLRVVVNCVRMCKEKGFVTNFFSDRRDKDFIIELASKVGVSCLKLFVSDWKDFFHADETKNLLLSMEPQICECKTLPKDVVTLIMQYFDYKVSHTDDACKLLSFFVPGDANYNKAVQKILANAEHYSPSALLTLAKLQYEHQKQTTRKSADIDMNDSTFQFVELAFAAMSSERYDMHAKLEHDLLAWLFNVCSMGNPPSKVVKGRNFSRLIALLAKSCTHHPDILLKALEHFEKSPVLLKQCNAVGNAYIDACKNWFQNQFCETSHSGYGQVINEMVKARLHCKQYVKNGEQRFDLIVVDSVKSQHSGKKKLLRMIAETFC